MSMNNERFEKEILSRNAAISVSLYEILGIRARDFASEAKKLQSSFEQSREEIMTILGTKKEGE